MSVVDFAFLLIVENLVCFADGLKADFCVFALLGGDFVGVVLEGGLKTTQLDITSGVE